mmetsp:Transcript_23631/g.23333  ORF Transcript_23631/g.23333 Transcript_23631/m.23333 type:complete len:105 (-) Transcript_23631:154-468(-)
MIEKAKAVAAKFMAEEGSDVTCSNHQSLSQMLAETDSNGLLNTNGEVDMEGLLERCGHHKKQMDEGAANDPAAPNEPAAATTTGAGDGSEEAAAQAAVNGAVQG